MLLSFKQKLDAAGDEPFARGGQDPHYRRVHEHLQIRARPGLLEVCLQDTGGSN